MMKWMGGRVSASVTTKLVVLLVLISLLPLIFTSLTLTNYSTDTTTLEAQEKQISLAQSNAKNIDYLIQHKIDTVQEIIKLHPEFKKGDTQYILSILKQIGEVDKEIEYFAYVDKNALSTNWEGKTSNVADRDYFIKAKETRKPAISDLLVNKKTGGFIIVLAIPLLDGDTFLGTINCTLNPASFARYSSDIKTGETGLSYIWSNAGTFITHPKKTHIGKTMNDIFTPDQVQAFKDTVFANDSGTMEFINSEGIPKMSAYSTVPSTGWKVMVTMDTSEVYSEVTDFVNISVVIVIAASVLVALISWYIGRRVAKPLRVLADGLKQVATGDLTVRVHPKSRDEIGQIYQNMNIMLDSMNAMIDQVNQSAQLVASSSEQLTSISATNVETSRKVSQAIQSVVTGAETQNQAAQQNTAAMEEMTAGIMRIAESAAIVSDTTTSTTAEVQQGNEAVKDAVRQMNAIQTSVKHTSEEIAILGELSSKIGEIVTVISDIASQTQMLSLNASIEAARAGEHGKGFAVVANEVKKLAEQSNQSAANIAQLISEVQGTTNKAIQAMNEGTTVVEQGTQIMNHVGEVFETIYSSVQHISDQIRDISAASEQISAGTQEVTSSMANMAGVINHSLSHAQSIDASSQEQLASMEQLSASSESLRTMAKELQETLSKFTTK
ncbi:methyl-accepting chemotaxis protein [Brevibacillus migulae]|uniref:methyl-accepting chemotaxis protein n=1 Tax=Brevibacillus migulae TaxID=1644114 RepID=UPI00106E4109|nr:methyl-accepting chemotaxis protein [Brevibacillus migulae]